VGDGVPTNKARDFCELLFAGKVWLMADAAFSVCALGACTLTF
jgi:hypothetical protein